MRISIKQFFTSGNKRVIGPISKHLGKRLMAGLIVVLPVLITWKILNWVVVNIDSAYELVTGLLPFVSNTSGVGTALFLITLYIAGTLVTSSFGKKIIHLFQGLLLRIPVVKGLYSFTKSTIENFMGNEEQPGAETALLKITEDIGFLGFVTSRFEKNGEHWVNFYVATSPTPNSGIVFAVRANRVEEVRRSPQNNEEQTPQKMSAAEYIKYVVTLGLTMPKEITTNPLLLREKDE